jgi:hypothetical protein
MTGMRPGKDKLSGRNRRTYAESLADLPVI